MAHREVSGAAVSKKLLLCCCNCITLSCNDVALYLSVWVLFQAATQYRQAARLGYMLF